ncbi:MAG: hypothetical protein ACRD6B_16965 [Bryobacteraceae bacterium]
MPCPYFEPLKPVPNAEVRLPLLSEFDGRCHAGADAAAVPEALRFRCNLGYSRGLCHRFPDGERRSCLRYHVSGRTASTLHVLCIEEQNYAPSRWYQVEYPIAADRLEPEIEDVSVRAQVLTFCRTYLERFG